MEPNLVCKIVVETSGGKRRRGSGYPITPNRIITAAHVIADAAAAEEGDARRITLFFGVKAEKLNSPVFIEWCGKDRGVDVAVLRCRLPSELQPAHRLLTHALKKPIAWFAHGYTDFGKQKRPDGRDGYYGQLIALPDDLPTVALDTINGPIVTKEWKGGSGSVVFDSDTGQVALAVVTEYQDGKKLDQLVAVPICYLLNSKTTQDGFRRAIQFDSDEQREDHCKRVIATIAAKLVALGKELLCHVAQSICQDENIDTTSIDLDANEPSLAKHIAECFVTHSAVIDVVRTLITLESEIGPQHADKINAIIDHLLPLNYAPDIIHRLREQSTGSPLVGLIENEVATQTLAEIIMAGYDRQPATFVVSVGHNPSVRGQPGLDYHDAPEEGPGARDSETTILRTASNVLADLVRLTDVVQGLPTRRGNNRGDADRSDVALEREMRAYANQLQGVLTGVRYRYRRTLYCVLGAPKRHEREFRRRVLSTIRQYIPQLLFVELIPEDQADNPVESELNFYIQGRIMRTP